jgi:cholesterol oxidase
MTEHYDAVVVGSGFGGSFSALRLAEAGLRVCVLERGKAYAPGSFPRSPHDLARNFWDPSEGLHGFFNVWSFRGLGAVVSSCLGGGSIIYANVLLRKDAATFVREDGEYWPVTREELEPHYERCEELLDGQRYPFEREPWSRTPKTRAMQVAAERMGREWLLPKLAVSFGDRPQEPVGAAAENRYGVTRLTCALTGECDIGCNWGSKNTLDLTVLSLAELQHGAEIRTRCEVKTLAPRPGGGYEVGYVDHSEAPEGRPRSGPLEMRRLTCDRLVVAAGAFGSTFLLLKNRRSFPDLSPRLGTRFSGNGDLLTFLVKSKDGRAPRILDAGYGPVITSAIRVPDAAEGGEGRGHYVEDAGYPQFVSFLLEGGQPSLLRRGVWLARRLARGYLRLDVDSDIGAEISRFLGQSVFSSSSMPLLGMGRDIPDGNMTLTDDGKLDVDWRIGRSNDYFQRVRTTARDIARALDADFRDNPLWYLSRVVTVHALGGCPMGRTPEEGVVDEWGQVFGYPGFVVADGSALPGPVGPNPSLTIAALADRFAARLASRA